MSDTWFNCKGGGAVLSKAQKVPRAIVAGVFEDVADHFRLLGWDVCAPATAEDAARIAFRKNAAVIVLPAETGCESGFLTAAKLRKAKPKAKLVLVGAERNETAERLAKFVGATFVAAPTAVDEVAKLV